MELATIERHGTAEVVETGAPWSCAAWYLGPILKILSPAVYTFRNRDDGGAGLRPYDARPGERRLTLKLIMHGVCDRDGEAYDDPDAGILSNLNDFGTNVMRNGATSTLRIVDKLGVTWEGPLQIEGFEHDPHVNQFVTTCGIVLPRPLTPTGP